MIGYKLFEFLEKHICLVQYKKEGATHLGYFTNNVKYIPPNNSNQNTFWAFNLIKECFEFLDPSMIQAVLCGSASTIDKIEASYNTSKQKLKRLKQSTSKVIYNYLLQKLTNHQDLVFSNSLTVEDFLFLLSCNTNSKKITLQKIKKLFAINLLGLSRSKILVCWWFDIEFGHASNLYKIKKLFLKTLSNAVDKEKQVLTSEWSYLSVLYPPLFKRELSTLLNSLDHVFKKAIVNSNSIHVSDEIELIIELSKKAWPKNIQPNPFLAFC